LEGLAAASVTDETPDNETFKQRQYDLLADHVRRHVDMARLYEILRLP
jgi:cobyric acid synthase